MLHTSLMVMAKNYFIHVLQQQLQVSLSSFVSVTTTRVITLLLANGGFKNIYIQFKLINIH